MSDAGRHTLELIRGLHNLRPEHRGCVATIGNFDGVHLGHQSVLGQLAEEAARLCLPTCVITFEPQPLEYFSPNYSPARLTRQREKLEALRHYAIDRVLLVQFNERFASLTAEAFIQQVLVEGLGIKYLVVGDDFRFGAGRSGDFDSLVRAGEQHGFEVVNMHSFCVDGERVSSTRIRQALEAGNLDRAGEMLGRAYRMSGRVAHGDKRGRTIGYPTANIHLHRKQTPVQGVYAVEVFGIAGEPVAGVANVGNRPTVDGTRTLLEVHLFDFDREIYGEYVQVSFLHKIRAEAKFDSFEALLEQIKLDEQQARGWFARRDGKID